MKELSIEEKAKAYDNALEIAKGLYAKDAPDSLHLERMFPQLKESEDEKIRKALIRTFNEKRTNEHINGVLVGDILAWLEKQREQDSCDNCKDVRLNCHNFPCTKKKAFEQGKSALEVINEENVDNANKVEPKFKIKYAGNEYNVLEVKDIAGVTFYGIEDEPNHIDYIKAENCERVDGYNVKESGSLYPTKSAMFSKQNPIDKVEPKFKAGDFVVIQETTYLISKIEGLNVTLSLNGREGIFDIDVLRNAHLYTIQDAKDGDVLFSAGFHNDCIFIFDRLDNWKFDEPNGDRAVATGYCCLFVSADKMEFGMQGPDCIEVNTIKPATKIQQDLLFQKMKEAGYEWDSEKKRLKKIDNEEINGEDYGIDGLWHAQRILEKTLGGVEGYQSDDGILEHKCAISAVKKLYDQKPAWSEEDERNLQGIIDEIEANKNQAPDSDLATYDRFLSWLKSLQPQSTWKPSDEQMEILLSEVTAWKNGCSKQMVLESLYTDLKKLK